MNQHVSHYCRFCHSHKLGRARARWYEGWRRLISIGEPTQCFNCGRRSWKQPLSEHPQPAGVQPRNRPDQSSQHRPQVGRTDCVVCRDTKWMCEKHPDREWPHDDCAGPAEPCPVCNTSDPTGLPADYMGTHPR